MSWIGAHQETADALHFKVVIVLQIHSVTILGPTVLVRANPKHFVYQKKQVFDKSAIQNLKSYSTRPKIPDFPLSLRGA